MRYEPRIKMFVKLPHYMSDRDFAEFVIALAEHRLCSIYEDKFDEEYFLDEEDFRENLYSTDANIVDGDLLDVIKHLQKFFPIEIYFAAGAGEYVLDEVDKKTSALIDWLDLYGSCRVKPGNPVEKTA